MLRLCVLLIVMAVAGVQACAKTVARPVTYADKTTEGFRFYDPLSLLVVTCNNAAIAQIPNLERGYAVQYRAYLAKTESNLKVSEGLLSESSAKLDNTALLSLLQAWGEKALGSVKDFAALGAPVSGTIPGMLGVWQLNVDKDSGRITGLQRIGDTEPGPCPNTGGSGSISDPPGKPNTK